MRSLNTLVFLWGGLHLSNQPWGLSGANNYVPSLPSPTRLVSISSTGAPIHVQKIKSETPLFAWIFPFLSFPQQPFYE